MKDNLVDILKSEWFIELQKLQDERRKTLKSGDNVIHLEYFGGFIDEEEIKDIEENLKTAKLELSRYDYSGFPQASLDDFLNTIFISIPTPLVLDILKGVMSAIVWEAIKYSIKKVWLNVRNKKSIRLTSKESKEQKITFGFNASLDNKTSFKFRLDGDLNVDIIDKTLDKAFDFLREQKLNDKHKLQYFVSYNKDLNRWEKIDVEKEIMKKPKNKKKK